MAFITKNWLQLNARVDADSNEQYSQERKSLEERKSRFRAKRFDANENEFANEKQFIKNGDPFKPIEDVIRDVEQLENLRCDSTQHNYNEDNSETIANTDKDRNALNGDKDSMQRLDFASEGEDISDANESNDIFTNNPLSDGKIYYEDKTSGVQNESPIDDSHTTDAEIHYNHNVDEIVEEVITRTDAKPTKGRN